MNKPDQTFEAFIKHSDGSYRYEPVTPKHVIAGDTDSVYIDLSCVFDKDADSNIVIKFADTLGEKVNDSFSDMLGAVFNIPEEKRGIVRTEREAVSDKSVFFGKKKYVMHVIDMEGKPVDKLKKMGVEIIKSDTPIVIQGFLQTIVDKMLDNASYDDIKGYVQEFKQAYYKMTMSEIGRPTNIKVLNKYYAMFQTNLNLMETYQSLHGVNVDQSNPMKDIPYHAKAAIIYNMKCQGSDVEIRAGDKMKITYVKDEPYAAIGIPSDLEVEELPKFMDEIEIDYGVMWEKVEKKLDLYLEPIGYDLKSRKEAHKRSFFFAENV